MPTAIETVQSFLAECETGDDAMAKAFRRYFTDSTVWENVGLATTTGIEEAVGFIRQFEANTGASAMRVDMLAIAAQGDMVLTERVDHLLKADGSAALSLRVMGVFEMKDGKIAVWRDYFDTAGMANGTPA